MLNELKEGMTEEEFESFMGKTFKILRGPYAGEGQLCGVVKMRMNLLWIVAKKWDFHSFTKLPHNQ